MSERLRELTVTQEQSAYEQLTLERSLDNTSFDDLGGQNIDPILGDTLSDVSAKRQQRLQCVWIIAAILVYQAKMEEAQAPSTENMEATALDIEFLPLVLEHKIHRNLKSSQVEIVSQPYYFIEAPAEPEPEIEGEPEPEPISTPVIYAPPLPALKEKKNWWDFVKPVYAFNQPQIRSRVERLMSNNIVHVTDRKYMVRLQERIKENHLDNLKKRIQEREADEVEREKDLLLAGKILYENAPAEVKFHPVCRISQMTKKIMNDKMSKRKTVHKTTAYKTHAKRIKKAEKVKKEAEFDKEIEIEDENQISTAVCVVDAEVSDDIVKGLMFAKEDYENLKYEDPLIKLLRTLEIVQEMYTLADTIIGPTKLPVKK